MPANTFKIVITASDKATATVRKVKDSIAQFTKPIRDVRASVGALGRELGVNKLVAGMGRLQTATRKVATETAHVVGKIAAVAGVGSIAALAAVTREWALQGAEVLRTAGIIGAATDRLQSLRGAADAMGLSGESLTSGLKALGDTMEDALFGRNQNALIMMNKLGISMHRMKDGSVDTARALEDVANAVQRQKGAQQQGLIARAFGVEELLPMLQKGAAGIREYERAVRASGAVMGGPALRQAQAFQYQLALMKLSITGTGNAIMGRLVPALSPLIRQFTDWSNNNRDLIAQNFVGFLQGVTGAVKDLSGVVLGIVKAMGGWKNVGYALAFMLSARLLVAVVSLIAPVTLLGVRIGLLALTGFPQLALRAGVLAEAIGMTGLARAFVALGLAIEATPIGWILTGLAAMYTIIKQIEARKLVKDKGGLLPGLGGALDAVPRSMPGGNQPGRAGGGNRKIDRGAAQQAMAFFMRNGWSKEQAAGIVGNMAFESGMHADQAEVGGGPGFGLEQWGRRRQQNFKRFSGKDIRQSTLMDQLKFAQFELTEGNERVAGRAIKGSKTASEAAYEALYNLERPLTPEASRASRQGLAEQLAAGGGGGGTAKHEVEVVIKGAPAGTTASVKSSGSAGGATKAGVKVEQSLPGAAAP